MNRNSPAFTPQQIADVFLRRWHVADIACSFVRHLKPMSIDKLIGEPHAIGYGEPIKIGRRHG